MERLIDTTTVMLMIVGVCLMLIVHPAPRVYADHIGNDAARAEVQALADFKKSLKGTTKALSSWDESLATPCDHNWIHIECDTDGYVTQIYLGKMGLGGTINGAALARLSRLNTIDLYENRIGGNIPKELGGIKNLKRLYLDNNNLNGSIPCELGNLQNLNLLWFSNNRLHGHCTKRCL